MVVQWNLMNPRDSLQNLCNSKIHEDRIAGKGFSSMLHNNLVHNFYSDATSNEDSGRKCCRTREMEKARDNPNMEFGKKKVKSKKETILQTERHKKNVHFATFDGHMSHQEYGVGTQNFKNTKTESCSVKTLWKTTLEPTQYSLNKTHLRPKWLLQKSWTLLQDYQVEMDKQLTQYLSILR